MPKSNRHTMGARLTYGAIRVFLFVIRIIPFGARVRFGGWFFRNPFGAMGARKRVDKNLRLIWPEKSEEERRKIADECLDNVGRTMIENFFFEEFAPFASQTQAAGPGLEALKTARDKGRAILLVSGHFGNHEAMRSALRNIGLEVGALYKPMSNPYFEKFWYNLISKNGRPMHPTTREGIANFRRDLIDGGTFAMLVDVRVTKGELFPFLGQDAYTSNAAGAFALEADALMIPVYGLRNSDKTSFTCFVDNPIQHSDPPTMIRETSLSLERQVTQNPGNWFWVHKRWGL